MPRLRALSFALCAAAAVAALPPPQVVVDLSQPPRRRWDGAIAKVLKLHPYEHSFGPVFEHHNRTLFDALSPSQWQTIGQAVRQHWPEAAEELAGIAEQFGACGAPEVSFEYLAGWLYFHELAHTDALRSDAGLPRECTAVVVQTPGGPVLHGGNMDQEPLQARNLTVRVRFVDAAGAVVFEGVDWYALLSSGVSRAVRRGVASVQENWRQLREPRPLQDVLDDIGNGVVSQMLVFRHAFVAAHSADAQGGDEPTFESFVRSIEHVPLAAPFFVICAGAKHGQGVVMARNLTGSDGTALLWREGDRTDPADGFLVQANTDRWLPDDPKDPRRTAAERAMRQLGHSEVPSLLSLFAVTSTYPVHNPHTAYTALMSAATGELHAYVREASCPIDPSATVVHEERYCSAPAVAAAALSVIHA